MRRPWTTKQALAIAFALLLLGFGVKCLLDGYRLLRDFESWQTARAMEGAIDLSRPGRFVFPFTQTCSSSHGEVVALRVAPELLQRSAAAELLAELDATLEIADKAGGGTVRSAASKIASVDALLDGAIPVFNVSRFPKGCYEATVTVVTGAPALKGIAQRLEARYLLCSLEQFPAAIAVAIGLASSALGILVGGVVVFLRARARRRPRNGVATADIE